MSKLLFPLDSEHGHVIEERPEGVVYVDDGTLVSANPRNCKGCALKVEAGGHDPCIANLPGTYQACCGHGLDKSPRSGLPNGYVALNDGRCLRFSGCAGGDSIRAAVSQVLAGDNPPDGFVFDEDRAWWEGLTDEQRVHVQSNIVRGLHELVVASGATPSAAFEAGQAMWWDGLDETQKSYVLTNMRAKLAQLVQEALRSAAPES